MRISHISLTARDAYALSKFYREVFGFAALRPPRRLSGEAVSRGNGLPGSDIYVIWLSLPGSDGPFLEIMQYAETLDKPAPSVNEPGYGHLAFEVSNVDQTVENVVRSGGELQGKVTNFGTRESPHLIVYVRDTEGNILELAQP